MVILELRNNGNFVNRDCFDAFDIAIVELQVISALWCAVLHKNQALIAGIAFGVKLIS